MAFTNSQLHVNQALTDYAISFRPEKEDYLWPVALPKKVVRHKSDYIRQINKAQILRLWDRKASSVQKSAQEVQFHLDANQTYACFDYSARAILDPIERANADDVLQYDQEQLFSALMAMQTQLEYVAIKQTLRNPAILTQNVAVTTPFQWDNYTSPFSDPINDIKIALEKVRVATGGKNPNFLAMHRYVWNQVQQHPAVLARGPVHTVPFGLGIITPALFEQILDIPPGSFHITSAQYNIEQESTALTGDYRAFIGPDCIIAYNEPNPGTRSYGLGQSFMFMGQNLQMEGVKFIPNATDPIMVTEFPLYGQGPLGYVTAAQVYGSVDFKVTVPDAGYLLTNVVNPANTALYGTMLQG